jgi:dissimilatory sulfite reductase (desulfoviridin) alpha/beta subunit
MKEKYHMKSFNLLMIRDAMNALTLYTLKKHSARTATVPAQLPCKGYKIEQGVASVLEELCIHCGKCVCSLPERRQKVRDDIASVEKLLKSGRK